MVFWGLLFIVLCVGKDVKRLPGALACFCIHLAVVALFRHKFRKFGVPGYAQEAEMVSNKHAALLWHHQPHIDGVWGCTTRVHAAWPLLACWNECIDHTIR